MLVLELLNAIEKNDTEKVNDILLKEPNLCKGEGSPKSPLWTAAILGHHEIVEILIKFGNLDVNEKKYFDEYTLLHWMGMKVMSYNEYHVKVYQILIQNGADINVLDRSGQTPLQYAIQKENIDWAIFLFENGASLDNLKWIPESLELHIFKKCNMTSHTDVIKLLFKHGLNRGFRNQRGENLLHIFIQLTGNSINNDTLKIAKTLIKSGVLINEESNNGRTPLHYSVCSNNVQLISFLVKEGADINLRDASGCSSLHLAVKLDNQDAVEVFLFLGAADIKAKTAALHTACRHNLPEMISLLIQNVADFRKKDKNGRTPFLNLLRCTRLESNDKAVKIMIREFAKLMFESIPISQVDNDYIQADAVAREYFESCLFELYDMFKIKFYGFYSYFTVLEMSRDLRKLAKLLKNKEFVSMFYLYLDRFTYYQSDLKNIFDEAAKLKDRA